MRQGGLKANMQSFEKEITLTSNRIAKKNASYIEINHCEWFCLSESANVCEI